MAAMEKVAWIEFVISVATVALVSLLIPWLGQGASGAFGLLGAMAVGGLFLRKRGSRVVVDERDREIDRRSRFTGIATAWMFLFLSLIGLVLWSVWLKETVVSIVALSWLIWIQFALCYGAKGLATILAYRRQRNASAV